MTFRSCNRSLILCSAIFASASGCGGSSNGYHDLVQAGKSVRGSPARNWEDGDMEQLRAFVHANREPLKLARRALSGECRVAVEYSLEYQSTSSKNVGAVRILGRLLQSEGVLAEREERTADAVTRYLDQVRLGQQGLRGGTALHLLGGLSIEETGLDGLRGLRDAMHAAQCRRAVKALENGDSRREPLEDVLAREQKLLEVTLEDPAKMMPVDADAMAKLSDVEKARIGKVLSGLMQPTLDRVKARREHVRSVLRLLAADLAVRAYFIDHAEYPGQLADVVPEYLSAVPIDPYSGNPLIYRKQGISYVLYSLGPDGRDDGGRRVPLKSLADGGAGDFFVDAE